MAAAEPACVRASGEDVSPRPIGITASIEDPRARTMHAWIQPPKTNEYHIQVDGGIVDICINGNADRLVSSVLLGTHAVSPSEALDRCASLLLSLLSSWSFQTQRPIGVRELLIEDRAHRAKWVRPLGPTEAGRRLKSERKVFRKLYNGGGGGCFGFWPNARPVSRCGRLTLDRAS
jgi:hypothetical protein